MKIKLINHEKLEDEQISDKVIRVKALIINSKKEILLGEAFGTIQFPGGHIEENENLNDALKREIKEETGIVLTTINEPFFAIKYYLKDYPVMGNNRSIEIYYYEILTDEEYHLDKMNLDDQEKNGDFKLFYVPLRKVKKILKKSKNDNQVNKIVIEEMNEALKEYKRLKNGCKKI